MMDKYAVDSADPVEEVAKEMVKTGSAESIEDARAEIQKKDTPNGDTPSQR